MSCDDSVSTISVIERELLTKVRLGDGKGAANVFQHYCKNLSSQLCCDDLVRVRTMELVVLVNREAREIGVPLWDIVNLFTDFLTKCSNIVATDSKDLSFFCNWVEEEILRRYSDLITEKHQGQQNLIVKNAIKFIQQNYQRDIGLDDISQAVFVSPFYLSHLFPQVTKKTVIEYLTEERIEAAKQMLITENIPIKEIAGKVGFANLSYFTQIFRKVAAITPGEYRSLKRNQRENKANCSAVY